MRSLAVILLACVLWAPATGTQAQWAALASAASKAAAVERAAAFAAKLATAEKAGAAATKLATVEKAGAAAAKAATLENSAGLAATKLAPEAKAAMGATLPGEASRAGSEASLAREARDFGVRRGEDGRFVFNASSGAAKLVRSRVVEAVRQSPPLVFARAEDGRYLSLGTAGGDALRVNAATDAVTDTIGTALYKAVDDLKAPIGEGRSAGARTRAPPGPKPGQLETDVKGLLKALHHPDTLKIAQDQSVSKLAGTRGVSLKEVEDVLVHEERSKPSSLLVQVAAGKSRPTPLVAQVNLDEILKRLDKAGF